MQELYIPGILTTAKNGYAIAEIHNNTDSRITLTLNSPINVISFPTQTQENFDVFHISNFFSQSSDATQKRLNINELIRTDHLNSEEKRAILSLCVEFSDIFHNEDKKLTFTNQIRHKYKNNRRITGSY